MSTADLGSMRKLYASHCWSRTYKADVIIATGLRSICFVRLQIISTAIFNLCASPLLRINGPEHKGRGDSCCRTQVYLFPATPEQISSRFAIDMPILSFKSMVQYMKGRHNLCYRSWAYLFCATTDRICSRFGFNLCLLNFRSMDINGPVHKGRHIPHGTGLSTGLSPICFVPLNIKCKTNSQYMRISSRPHW